ncbi:MAG: hypothetical protein GY751_14750 [Bacteroidetes bacterium]|nr:hypothetical protein [Bacteroidota bacterium]
MGLFCLCKEGDIEMGMFDSVYAACPVCGGQVEFQSKAGICDLKRYHMTAVPPEIASDIDDYTVACKCGAYVTLKLATPIPRVQMFVVKKSDEFD